MTITSTYEFDLPGSYTFDPACLEVTGGSASILLANNPGQSFNQDFSSSTGFTFPAADVQFASGIMEQIDRTAAGSTIGCTYTTSLDASWNKQGATTGTLNGTPVLNAGKMDCLGVATKGIYYPKTIAQQGTIKVKYTPNYTVGPSSNINIVSLGKDGTNSEKISFFNSPSGNNIRITAYNTSGSLVASAVVIGAFSFVSGQEYEIACQFDSTNGQVQCYIDGTRIGNINVGSWTRASSGAGRIWAGATTGIYNLADGSFNDLTAFDTVVYSGNSYTTGYSINETVYLESKTDLPQFSYSGLGAIQEYTNISVVDAINSQYILNGLYYNGSIWTASDGTFAQSNDLSTVVSNIDNLPQSNTLDVSVVLQASNIKGQISDLTIDYTGQIYQDGCRINPTAYLPTTSISSITASLSEPANTSVRFTYIVSAAEYYHNGSDWVASTGVIAETNTIDEINDNLSTLPISVTGSFAIFRAYLFTDGTDTPSLDQVDVTFTYDVDPLAAPDKTILFGTLRDIATVPQKSSSLRVVAESQFFIGSNSIEPSYTIGKANSEGVAFVEVISTDSISYKYHFYIDYIDEEGNSRVVDLGYSEAPSGLISNIASLTFTSS